MKNVEKVNKYKSSLYQQLYNKNISIAGLFQSSEDYRIPVSVDISSTKSSLKKYLLTTMQYFESTKNENIAFPVYSLQIIFIIGCQVLL